MSKRRAWCFTLNNWTDGERKAIDKADVTYLIYGVEIGKKDTPHLQGYVEFKCRKRLTTIKKIDGFERMHLEPRIGTQKQAIEYCKKEDDWYEFGKPLSQGKRADLDKVRQLALDDGMRAVVRTCNAQQIRVAERYLMYCEDYRDFKPKVIWICGASGVGKSKTARKLCNGSDDVFTKNTGTKWWCGYDSQEYLIIDDFRDSWWPITYFLGLIDRYEFRIEYKGGMRQMRSKVMIITSLFHPKMMYTNCRGDGESIEQILRRIDEIIEL